MLMTPILQSFQPVQLGLNWDYMQHYKHIIWNLTTFLHESFDDFSKNWVFRAKNSNKMQQFRMKHSQKNMKVSIILVLFGISQVFGSSELLEKTENDTSCLPPFQTCGRVTLYCEVSRFDTLKIFMFKFYTMVKTKIIYPKNVGESTFKTRPIFIW